uniref:Phosphoglycerate mutase-like protein n=1 Tax=Amphora coffeiformis TaxID=265554 RepID=A0A6S8KEJ6_9STRA
MTTLSEPSLFDEPLPSLDSSSPNDESNLKAHLRRHERMPSVETMASTASVSSPSSHFEDESFKDEALMTVDVFPYNTSLEDLRGLGYTKVKKIHWIRHAQGYHNVGDAKSRDNIDARLTPTGIEQCRTLAAAIKNAPEGSPLHDVLNTTELIVTSPVTRCIQTALHSLQPLIEAKPGVPIVANDSIRETVNFNCDRRRPIHEIAQDFPQVDFTQACPFDEDNIWEYYVQMLGDDTEYTEDRESAEIHTIADRCRQFFVDWLQNRPEENIAVCCHATVSRCIFNFGMKAGKTPTDVKQVLDNRDPDEHDEDEPVVNFGHHAGLEKYMREDFKNCELRSMIIAYKN